MNLKKYLLFSMFVFLFIKPACLWGYFKWDANSIQQCRSMYPSSQRDILLYFHRENCSGCQLMLTRTFNDQNVSDVVSKISKIDIDCDETVGKRLAEEFSVNKFPAMILLNHEEKEISRRLGMLPPREFIIWVQDGLRRKNVLSELLSKLKNSPDDINLNLAVARIYRDRIDTENAAQYYRKVRESDPLNEQGLRSVAIVELAHLFYETGRFNDAIILYKIFLKKFSHDRLAEIVYLDMIQTYIKTKQMDDATEAFRAYRNLYKNNYRVHYSFAQFCLDHVIFPGEALDAALEASRLKPDSVEILEILAKAYAVNGECAKAIESINKALQLDSDSEILHELSVVYHKKKCR
ncbi:MAG: hypothetical protein A2161_02710 [Candidatus Schekmanbacteria bacterium RBG_13_48_7]|uniref:Thioredoxin-like fold domain-containing protein n=1 Tax=Candidatus Schekmanbacteria bacterium RBG_13_48_7 TaxID=1817878 RepID=A0A1F7S4E3_9BACT|nr:MAG: hypothetical protein A2161_02710 [Candidatus Schekmanbacteria bacterium RBG_13_48_7]